VPSVVMNWNFKKAIPKVAKVIESNRSSLVAWHSLAARKSWLPKGLREAPQDKPHALEIEAIVRIAVEAVIPALGYSLRRGQLPQLRQAFQKALMRRRCGVSYRV
jgi:hypothetical protein